MTYRYYIASGLENFEQVRELKYQLDFRGWHHTFDWTTQGHSNNGSLSGAPLEIQGAAALAEEHGVASCDVFILLLPGKFGTHWELGAATVLRKRVFVATSDAPRFLAPAAPNRCMFYHHPGVTKIIDESPVTLIDSVIQALERAGLLKA